MFEFPEPVTLWVTPQSRGGSQEAAPSWGRFWFSAVGLSYTALPIPEGNPISPLQAGVSMCFRKASQTRPNPSLPQQRLFLVANHRRFLSCPILFRGVFWLQLPMWESNAPGSCFHFPDIFKFVIRLAGCPIFTSINLVVQFALLFVDNFIYVFKLH